MSINFNPNPQSLQLFQQTRSDFKAAGIDPKAIQQQAIQTAIGQVTDPTLKAKLQTDLTAVQSLGTPTLGSGFDPQRGVAEQQLQADLRSSGIDVRALGEQAVQTAVGQIADPTLKAKLQTDLTAMQALRQQDGGLIPGEPPAGFLGGFQPDPQLQAAGQQYQADLQAAGIDPKAIQQQSLQTAIGQVTDSTLKAKLQSDLTAMQALGAPTPGAAPDPQRRAAAQQLFADLGAAGVDPRTIAQQAMQTAISQVADPTLKAKLQTDQTTLQTLRKAHHGKKGGFPPPPPPPDPLEDPQASVNPFASQAISPFVISTSPTTGV
jgi:hypothetical protein